SRSALAKWNSPAMAGFWLWQVVQVRKRAPVPQRHSSLRTDQSVHARPRTPARRVESTSERWLRSAMFHLGRAGNDLANPGFHCADIVYEQVIDRLAVAGRSRVPAKLAVEDGPLAHH